MTRSHATLRDLFGDVADAIREKDGTSAEIVADDFPAHIRAIPSGSSGHKVFFINFNDSSDTGTFEHNEDGVSYEIAQGSGSGSVALSIMAGIETLKIGHFDHWGGGIGSSSASWGAWRPHQSNWQTWRGAGGTIISGGKTSTTLTLTQDIDLIIHSGTCLTGDMLILMADGTEQRVDSLEVGDLVMTPEGAEEVIFSDSDIDQYGIATDVWTFSDGTVIKTVNPHRFYNIERGAFTYMAEWKLGDHGVNRNGERIELVDHEIIEGKVKHYTIFVGGCNAYYVNGLLSGNRFSRIEAIR